MVWFANVTRADARALAVWWNAHASGRYFAVKAQWTVGLSARRARYNVVREA